MLGFVVKLPIMMNETEYFKLTWINVNQKKLESSNPIVYRFESIFWFEIITISDIKRKINFINEVLLLQNTYTLVKSSACPPLL